MHVLTWDGGWCECDLPAGKFWNSRAYICAQCGKVIACELCPDDDRYVATHHTPHHYVCDKHVDAANEAEYAMDR